MQKIVNVFAVASFVVSGAVVGGGFYLYSQKDAIIEDIKEKALGSVLGGVGGGALGGAVPKMPMDPDFGNLGAPDLAPSPSPDQAAVPSVMGPAPRDIGPR